MRRGRSRFRGFLKNFERIGTKKPQWFLHVVRGFCNAYMRKIFPFFFGFKRAVPAVADLAGKRVARPLRHTVLILHIVPTAFSVRGDFSRPDAVFGLFFEVYELPDFPERITRFSGTNYQIFRNELPDFPTSYLNKWLLKRV